MTVFPVRDQVRALPSFDSAWMSASSDDAPPSNLVGWPLFSGGGENPFSGPHRHQDVLAVQAVVVAEVSEEATGRQKLDTLDEAG